MESWGTKLKNVTGEGPARSRDQMVLPEVKQLVDSLLASLTDPMQRQAAVQVVQQQCLPVVQSRVIDELVEVVKREGAVNSDAVASLVDFGPPALKALTRALERALIQDLDHSRSTAVQLHLMEALRVFAGHPSFTGHAGLAIALEYMWPRAANPDIRGAIGRLLAAVRTGAGTQPGSVR